MICFEVKLQILNYSYMEQVEVTESIVSIKLLKLKTEIPDDKLWISR